MATWPRRARRPTPRSTQLALRFALPGLARLGRAGPVDLGALMIGEIAPEHLALAFLLTLLGAWVQGTLGLGFAIVTVPLLGLLDPRLVPVPQMLVVVQLTALMAHRERHAIELRGMLWVTLGRLPGAAIGIALVKLGDQRTLDVAIGGSVILAAAILGSGWRLQRNPITEGLAGVTSGVTGMVSAIGGPPVALLYRNDRAPSVRANLAGIFLVGVSVTLATRALAQEIGRLDVELGLFLLPALLLGLAASHRTRAWVEGPRLTRGVLALSTLAGVALILRSLTMDPFPGR